MKRYFTYQDDKSDKFWSVEVEDNALIVVFGRTGTGGTMNIKEFVSQAEAQKQLEKLVAQKLKKGYKESAEPTSKTEDPFEPPIFKYIQADTLTKAKLTKLFENDDLNFADANNNYEDIWTFACRLERYEAIKTIVEWAHTNDEVDVDRLYPHAYETKNFRLLLLLLEHMALHDDSECSQYLDQDSELIPSSIESMKARIVSDQELQKHPELLDIIDTARYINLAMDVTGRVDPIDCTIVEIGKKTRHRLEYFEVDNWSYEVSHLFLQWKSNDRSEIILDFGSYDHNCLLETYARIRPLAVELGIEHLSIDAVLKFFALLLSRKMQVFNWDWHKHKLFQLLDKTILEMSDCPLKLPIKDLR